MEMSEAMELSRQNPDVGVIIITGEGGKAFCSGGDQKVRGVGGYVGEDKVPRLNGYGGRVLGRRGLGRIAPVIGRAPCAAPQN
jgi:1,4-dihydroxy-2-naphthoyl-CoA synthase